MKTHRKPASSALLDVLLLTTAEAAAVLHVSPHTLIDWRRPGFNGPDLPWVQIGRKVFYRSDDVARMVRVRCHPARSDHPRSGLTEQSPLAA